MVSDILALARDLVSLAENNIPIRDHVGASDVSALKKRNPWKRPIDVWLRCVEGIDTPAGPQARAGLIFEPIVAVMFEELKGAKLVKAPSIVEPFGCRRIRVSPDFDWPEENAGVEIKTSWSWFAPELWSEGVPDFVRDQTQVQMTVTGREKTYVPVLIQGVPQIFEVQRDQALGEELFGEMIDFVETYVIPGVMPEVEATETFGQYLRRKYPRDVTPLRDATPSEDALAADWLRVKSIEEEAHDQRDQLAAKLRLAIADAGGLRGMFGAVTYKADKNGKRSLKVAANNVTKKEAA